MHVIVVQVWSFSERGFPLTDISFLKALKVIKQKKLIFPFELHSSASSYYMLQRHISAHTWSFLDFSSVSELTNFL